MISESDYIEQVRLGGYARNSFDRGRPLAIVILWRIAGCLLPLLPLSRLRKLLLQSFGAIIGAGVIMQSRVRVRYPWRLIIGRDSWIGESCWIDNWAPVVIGDNVCISQSVYLCTGNHDWTDPHFAIAPKSIVIGDSAWVGARAVIGPGVELGNGAIAAVGSVVVKTVPPWEIHAGNPARFIKIRRLKKPAKSDAPTNRVRKAQHPSRSAAIRICDAKLP